MVERLLEAGHTVRCLVRKTSNLQYLRGLPVEFAYGDIAHPDTLPPALKGADYIFHFAGLTKARTKEAFLQVNAEGTANLARAALEVPELKRLVYCSSLAAVGPQKTEAPLTEADIPHPLTVYGRSKLRGEELLREVAGDRLDWTILRPTGIYGPRDTDIFIYFKLVHKGWKAFFSGSQRPVSLIHAADLADLCLKAAEKAPPQSIYLASDGESYTYRMISAAIERAKGKKARTLVVPMPLVSFAALVSETVCRLSGQATIFNREKVRELEAPGWAVSMEKAFRELDFRPRYDLDRGIRETYLWYKEKGWLG